MADVQEATETPVETPVASEPTPEPQSQPESAPEAPEPSSAPEPAPEAPYWAEDWRQTLAGKDENALKFLNRYKDPSGLWKAHKALRTRMDSGDLRPKMPDTEDEAALAEWRQEMGIPETFEGYYEDLPEGMEVSEFDKPLVDDYFTRMHKMGVDKAGAHEGLKTLFDAQAQVLQARAEEDARQKQALDDELYSAYGVEKTGQLNNMEDTLFRNDFFVQAPDELRDRMEHARFDDGSKLMNDPDFVSWMMQAASVINPQGTVTPQTGHTQRSSIDTEIESLELEMQDAKGRDPGGYWHNDHKQARYRELLDLRDKMAARV
jgi:hypothetical protein